MSILNANLLGASGSPIMETAGWVQDATLPEGKALIDLSQAAPASPPPEPIRQRLAEAMLHEPTAHFYGPVLGNSDLREALAARTTTLYGGAVSAGHVAITAGCNQAFCVAVATACGPGDAVALPAPWYFNHKMWLDMAGIECVPLPCLPDMSPDPEAARDLPPHVRAIALVSPNNPTGAEYPADLLDAFYRAARERGRLLILDETYRDFHSSPGAPHRLFEHEDWPDVLAHLYSFSKAYRMTGHRTGALITGEARIAQAEKFLDTVTICAAQSGQIAALFGLENLSAWVNEQRLVYLGRRRHLEALIAAHLPDWTLHGAGAYFAWVSPPFDLPSRETAQRLIAEQALLVLPGSYFMPEGTPTGALRIAFANADDDGIAETISRLAAFRP
ncbi:MAG: aminotransferase [Pseudomonadota bacterium]